MARAVSGMSPVEGRVRATVRFASSTHTRGLVAAGAVGRWMRSADLGCARRRVPLPDDALDGSCWSQVGGNDIDIAPLGDRLPVCFPMEIVGATDRQYTSHVRPDLMYRPRESRPQNRRQRRAAAGGSTQPILEDRDGVAASSPRRGAPRGRLKRGLHPERNFAVGDDGLAPLQCPADADHRFKVALTQSASGEPSGCYCPYCGTQAATDEFMADQMPLLEAAMEAAAEQYADQALDDILSKAFGKRAGARSPSGLFDVSISYQPGRPPPRRILPTYDIEPTRRTMRCNRCSEAFAVYGLAIYCPTCGQLAPAQQFAELIRVQRDRLPVFDGLDAQTRREFLEAGVVTSTYESTLKDGFGALETYLKNRFQQDAKNVTKPQATTTFQRLDDTNEL